MIRFGGLYDDYPSRLYRWATCVVVGVIFIGVGIVGVVTSSG